jgi:hypothetical protein
VIEETAAADEQTPEGVRYKAAFEKTYRELVQQCVRSDGGSVTQWQGKFKTLTNLGPKGTVEDIRIQSMGPVVMCLGQKLYSFKQENATPFPPPPQAPYWIELHLDWADFAPVQPNVSGNQSSHGFPLFIPRRDFVEVAVAGALILSLGVAYRFLGREQRSSADWKRTHLGSVCTFPVSALTRHNPILNKIIVINSGLCGALFGGLPFSASGFILSLLIHILGLLNKAPFLGWFAILLHLGMLSHSSERSSHFPTSQIRRKRLLEAGVASVSCLDEVGASSFLHLRFCQLPSSGTSCSI